MCGALAREEADVAQEVDVRALCAAGRVHRVSLTHMKRFAFASILFATALSLAGCYTNPVTGRRELVLVTPEQELSLGAQSFAEVQKTERVSTDRSDTERVRRVGQRIAAAVGNDLPGAQWEFVVFDSKEVNAFALPGGKVGVYSGLLQLASNDDELATVIGHEIAHVTARHGAERVSLAMGAEMLGQVGGQVLQRWVENPTWAQGIMSAYGVGAQAAMMPHSQKQEMESDYMGIVYSARAGYDPRAAVAFWQKMAAQKGNGQAPGWLAKFLSTHPTDADRIAQLNARMPEVLQIYQQTRR